MTRTRIPNPLIRSCADCGLDRASGHACPHCTPAARPDLNGPDLNGPDLDGHDQDHQDQGPDLGGLLYELRRIADALDLLTGRPGPVGSNPTTRLGETPT